MANVRHDLDANAFDEAMAGDDLMTVVIRAHLFVERDLTALIRHPLPRPDLLRRNWSFAHRLQLVGALGLLGPDELEAYEYLDDLRNRYAHRLGYELSLNEQDALIARVAPPLDAAVNAQAAGQPFPEGLKITLKLLVLRLSMVRHTLTTNFA